MNKKSNNFLNCESSRSADVTLVPQNLTKVELHAKLREILEKWPPYRAYTYLGAHETHLLPPIISLYCPSCKKDQWWERTDQLTRYSSDRSKDSETFSDVNYRCRNCGSRTAQF